MGSFYHTKGSNPAAANRLEGLVNQYPLYSRSDEALWNLADSYSKMGPRFREKSGEAYARIVKDYPLSALVDEAKTKLTGMELPVPEPDPVAYARMKYELENRQKAGMMSHAFGIFRKSPDVRAAAKSGQPAMTSLRPNVPASVPAPGATGTGVSADVTATTVTDSTALDTQPDARRAPPAAAKPEEAAPAKPAAEPNRPNQKNQKKKNNKKNGK